MAATVALVAMIVSGIGVPAQARRGEIGPSAVWQVADLSVSKRPAGAPWLDGRVLHTASGDVRTLPWTVAGARSRHLRLLGHTPKGWLVRDFSDSSWNVWRVRGPHRHKLSSTGVSEGDVVTMALSTKGTRYAVSDFDGDDSSFVVVRDLTGHKVAQRSFAGDGALLDLSRSRAVIGTTATAVWWFADPEHLGTGSVTELGVDGVTASLAHDSVLVRDGGTDDVGPTSLSAPGTPSWSAPLADPRISPDGSRVIGRNGSQPDWLDLRALSDGHLVSRIEVDHVAGQVPSWDTDHAYVVIGATNGTGDHERLVRCTAAGHCRGQSAVRPRGQISLPPR